MSRVLSDVDFYRDTVDLETGKATKYAPRRRRVIRPFKVFVCGYLCAWAVAEVFKAWENRRG